MRQAVQGSQRRAVRLVFIGGGRLGISRSGVGMEITAFTAGFTASIWARQAAMASRAETCDRGSPPPGLSRPCC